MASYCIIKGEKSFGYLLEQIKCNVTVYSILIFQQKTNKQTLAIGISRSLHTQKSIWSREALDGNRVSSTSFYISLQQISSCSCFAFLFLTIYQDVVIPSENLTKNSILANAKQFEKNTLLRKNIMHVPADRNKHLGEIVLCSLTSSTEYKSETDKKKSKQHKVASEHKMNAFQQLYHSA